LNALQQDLIHGRDLLSGAIALKISSVRCKLIFDSAHARNVGRFTFRRDAACAEAHVVGCHIETSGAAVLQPS
jgi:hypothetical protein